MIETPDNVELRPQSIKQEKEGQVFMLKAISTKAIIYLCMQITEQQPSNSETTRRSKNKLKLNNNVISQVFQTGNTPKN